MMKTSRAVRKTNDQIRTGVNENGVNEKKDIIKTINSRQTTLFGRLTRSNDF